MLGVTRGLVEPPPSIPWGWLSRLCSFIITIDVTTARPVGVVRKPTLSKSRDVTFVFHLVAIVGSGRSLFSDMSNPLSLSASLSAVELTTQELVVLTQRSQRSLLSIWYRGRALQGVPTGRGTGR